MNEFNVVAEALNYVHLEIELNYLIYLIIQCIPISTEVYFDYIYVIPYNAASPNIDYNNWVCCESHWTFRACTDIETK